ncbi:MAG TPA: hypothetical protein VKV17_09210 [Bryobacteraceae bacterium]|nr:hypothetical protein [Bryobacteraceae bacterium]
MVELTLHFEAGTGTDIDAAAEALQRNLAKIPEIEFAHTEPQRFQAAGPSEVISTIQVATTIVQNATAFLTALGALYAAWEKVKPMFPGLHPPKVEVGLKQVPVNQLTPEHRAELAAGA